MCACSGAPVRVLKVDPADATVFVNGVATMKGGSRPLVFDFSSVDRIYVQATHPDYVPHIEWFDREMIDRMIETNTQVTITLQSRQ
ncbi:MAG: hypothetical protein U1F60_02215 [Planctomycetota bacterium]